MSNRVLAYVGLIRPYRFQRAIIAFVALVLASVALGGCGSGSSDQPNLKVLGSQVSASFTTAAGKSPMWTLSR